MSDAGCGAGARRSPSPNVLRRGEAALEYARRGWPVFPVRADKRPLTDHGSLDATCDPNALRDWWRRWPKAAPAIATGERSTVVALDIDLRRGGNGFDSLAELGVAFHPESPTAHTPRGGCAVLFRWPGCFVKTIAGALGPYLDIRGDGGSLILPPSPGRFWDPVLGLNTPIAPMPEWMVIAEPELPSEPAPSPRPTRPQHLSRYGEAALDAAVKAIIGASAGQQRDTLNREIYSIARLVAGGSLPASLAIESLRWAASQLRSYDLHRPWRPAELDKIVRSAFADGLVRPRQPQHRQA
jgi:Bifunctional DNA primase/polymerase, N-terminal